MNIYRREYLNSDGFLVEIAGQVYTFAGLVKRYLQICNDTESGKRQKRGWDGRYEDEGGGASAGKSGRIDYEPKDYKTRVAETYVEALSKKDLKTIKSLYFGEVDAKAAEKIERETGLNVKGYRRRITNRDMRHIIKRHGSEATESPRGQIPVTKEDFLLLPKITEKYDTVKTEFDRDGSRVLVYQKRIGGRYYYVETVGGKNKVLSAKSMRIFKDK
jgi:hypothetical protein